MRLRRLADAEPVPWKNGGGLTRELLREPAEGPVRLRISVADVASEGPFSLFPGVERVITLLSGAGFRLRGLAWEATLTGASPPFRFPGDVPVTCDLLDGPIRDVNVMWTRSLADHHVRRRRTGAVKAGSVIVALGPREVGVTGEKVQLAAGDVLALGAEEPAELRAGRAAVLVVAPR